METRVRGRDSRGQASLVERDGLPPVLLHMETASMLKCKGQLTYWRLYEKSRLKKHTSNPSPILRHLLDNLPEFTTGDRTCKLNSFANSINVDGKHQTIPNGSSCNNAEVDVVESLVEQLKINGKPESSITISTGYLWQLENLKKAAKKKRLVRSPKSLRGHKPTCQQADQTNYHQPGSMFGSSTTRKVPLIKETRLLRPHITQDGRLTSSTVLKGKIEYAEGLELSHFSAMKKTKAQKPQKEKRKLLINKIYHPFQD